MLFAFVNPQGGFDAAGSRLSAHPDFGGQLVYVREAALALATLGHEVHILTRQVVDAAWPEFAAPEDGFPQAPGVRILRLPCGPPRFLPKEELWPWLHEWNARIIEWYGAEGRSPDVWTGHYADGGACAALLSAWSDAPFTFTAHSLGAWKLDGLLRTEPGTPVKTLDRRYRFGARLAAERTAIARADAIVANSTTEQLDQYAHPAYRAAVSAQDSSRFAVIPPGVDLALFGPDVRTAREDEVLASIHAALARDVSPERAHLPPVVAWSRLAPTKNHIGLVRAFAASPELRARANLIIITRGLDDPLRRPETAGPDERVVLGPIIGEIQRSNLWGGVSAFNLEGQDALAALHRWTARSGGVFCLPSEHEPFSLSIVEAMGSGVPVVATTNGGPREITDYGRVGLLADPLDPLELASQLLKLVSSREEHAYFSAAGRARVLERYSWECTAKGYARLAEELVGCERRSAASAYSGVCPIPRFMLQSGASLPLLGRWTPALDPAEPALGLPLQGYPADSKLPQAPPPTEPTTAQLPGMMG